MSQVRSPASEIGVQRASEVVEEREVSLARQLTTLEDEGRCHQKWVLVRPARQQWCLQTLTTVRHPVIAGVVIAAALQTLAAPLGHVGYPHTTTSMKRAEL
jgi:hypothetical protein